MKVLFAAAEMAPFAKTGGLGDVVGSLPIALRKHGLDVRVVMPHYSTIYGVDYRYKYTLQRRIGTGDVFVHSTVHEGVPVYFLRSWPYFVEDGQIYTDWEWDTPRFIYFCQMVMAFIEQMAGGANDDPWFPDVLHVNDWHTSFIPFLLYLKRFEAPWRDLASVLSIHNMGYQGDNAGKWLDQEGFPDRTHRLLPTQRLRDNLLAIGLAYAHKLNTVSPGHAEELRHPRFGMGLEEIVQGRDEDFFGILNGLDMDFFDPATDPAVVQNYDASTFHESRVKNKLALQQYMNLEENPTMPVIGLVSRLTDQKGIDFTIPALRHILATAESQFVGLGSGDPVLEKDFGQIGWDFGWKARTYLMYNNQLARQIYAGADLLLVPSRYEPCGLAQMIAMRYGCLPVVRETGGLADTVENYDGGIADIGSGFMFLFEDSQALIDTVRWALSTYRNNYTAWARMQERAMRRDWSWNSGVKQYVNLYEEALAAARVLNRDGV